jgi:hypothetical protein
MTMPPRSTHINARCTEEQKQAYIDLAASLGYGDGQFSEFLIDILEALRDSYNEDAWTSGLVHLSENRVVAAEAHEVDGVPMATAAFHVVAPATFWRHVRRHVDVSGDDDPDASP